MTKSKIYSGLCHLKSSFFFAISRLPMKGNKRLTFVKMGGGENSKKESLLHRTQCDF